MDLNELNKKSIYLQNIKLKKEFTPFEKLINELKKKELPDKTVIFINTSIEEINTFSGSEKELKKQIQKAQTKILKLIEKELKLVLKNHYRNTCLAIGMVIGLASGSVISLSFENPSLLALGIPFGLAIGIAIGTAMDKKAKDNGLQLDLEIKY